MSATPLATPNVYREIFFAGFPQQAAYHAAYVKGFFAHYGEVQDLVFDANRGMGSVTFSNGEVAVACYLAVNLTLLPPPAERGASNVHGEDNNCLIVMEFAQCAPCVNPCLLLNGELSRHLMRHRAQAPVANHVVMTWHETTEASTRTTAKRRLVREGPHFPVTDAATATAGNVTRAMNNIHEAVWSLLRPEKRLTADGAAVTVLDLWWGYYQRYMLHKTEPAQHRIKDPYFAFAHKATVAQEVQRALKLSQTGGSGDAQEAMRVVNRLTCDDVYHSVCNYLCMKLRFRNDPSWASLARDVAAAGGAVAKGNYKGDAEPNSGGTKEEDGDVADADEEVETAEAVKALLRLPILQTAANLIDNVRFLHKVRCGEITVGNKPGRPREGADDDTWMGYPASARQEERSFCMEVLTALDGFSPTGTAVSLMAICEDPHTFQCVEGHIGWCELHGKKRSTWWVTCQAMLVVVLIFLVVGCVIYVTTTWLGVTGVVGNTTRAVPSRFGMHSPTEANVNIRFAEL
ncbi:hypothetical protein TraAM80_01292 [Trypanosoma rangeli]|uniref:RRM domain-containing protein n=1 Tax=Trypanosoma rangeli TaxID=5698 RepID=A0A422NZM2_TRYRA|nr:uncharacterized protein TraAM80_01292 [Trypanosoma rangeli]RNF10908.1 hypothetical protein TraAM80_01292 [Trypanosoma rangeli]|eukprot:RNF10908.1 hypothetical protein TraAM80_01292 [Trypanosoma rangeli]